MQGINIVQKTIVQIFYPKQEQIKKLYPTEKRQQPLQTFQSETVKKIFGLAGQGGGSTSITHKILRLCSIFQDSGNWDPNRQKNTTIFLEIKSLNQKLTSSTHVKAEKTAAGGFRWGGGIVYMVRLLKATIRPPNEVFGQPNCR